MKKKIPAKKPAARATKAQRQAARRKPAPAAPGRRYELIGLLFFAAGLISACGLAGLNVGFVGLTFAKCLHYLFGVGAALVVLLILLIGWQYMTKHHGLRYSLRFFGLTALFALALAAYHHFVTVPGAEILPESLPRGGGLIGGGLLLIIRRFFGVDGAIIVIGVGLVGAVLLSTTWSLAAGLLKTEETAKRGAQAAGKAVAVTCDRVAEVGERAGGQVVEKVRAKAQSFYNQAADHRFSEPPVAEQTADEGETVAAAAPQDASASQMAAWESELEREASAEPPAATAPEPPRFTIDYGARGAEEPALTPEDMAAEEDEADEEAAARAGLAALAAAGVAGAAEAAAAVPTAAGTGSAAAASAAHLTKAPEYSTLARSDSMTAHFPGEDAPEHPPAAPAAPPPKPYVLPKVTDILAKNVKKKSVALEMEIEDNARTLAKTLHDFHVDAKIINACHGPAVTRYELEPAPGVKVSKITNLSEDLALSLAAFSVRIEPIPGKAAIGIEVPNKELEGVRLREVLENEKFAKAKSKLTVGLGMDIGGQAIFADLAKMPHLLVAGATGSGKSVCINTLITSILFKAKPDEVKFILIDPKMVELSNYNGIPHLMVPVVTEAKKAASVLNWAVQEMEKRYAKFAEHNVRNMQTYNAHFPEETMPAIVIIIDELADLMMVAPHDVEDAICRLAQKARAAGIHMVLATQRPSVDVITGIIKANIPSRISFAVSSQIDSRTILDASGAEKLLGKGDMLFYPVGAAKPRRVQGAFISDEEVEKLLDFIRSQGQEAETNEEIVAFTENAMREEEEGKSGGHKKPKIDELLGEAVNCVMSTGIASSSGIQRRFSIGYTRAARLIDTMAELGIVGPSQGSKPRDILMSADEARQAVEQAVAANA